MMSWRDVHDYSDFLAANTGPAETATPMRFAHIVRLNGQGARETVPMRWGFMGLRAKNPSGPPEHVHARSETLDERPTFRAAFANARGLLVVKTFNEGKEIAPRKTEQHTITPRDGKPIGIAVLWERWEHPEQGELLTFVMVTTPANRLISSITDRMPAVLAPEHWAKWLGEEPATPAELKALLQPFEGDWNMEAQSRPPKPKPAKPGRQTELF